MLLSPGRKSSLDNDFLFAAGDGSIYTLSTTRETENIYAAQLILICYTAACAH